MIIETNTNLYRAIRHNWLLKQPSDRAVHLHKLNFIQCLNQNNAQLISNRRLQSRDKFQFEDVLGVMYGVDYIKFNDEQSYLLFILTYS